MNTSISEGVGVSVLDDKINEHFAGLVVRKDLVKAVKGNAIVPSYVLEFLLGQYCATDDEAVDRQRDRDGQGDPAYGIMSTATRPAWSVRRSASAGRMEGHRPKWRRSQHHARRLRGELREPGYQGRGGRSRATVKTHPKLLVGGRLVHRRSGLRAQRGKRRFPWVLNSAEADPAFTLRFRGLSSRARAEFTTDEWIDLLVQTVGFDPALFGRRSKLLQLMRLIPFVERNYNLIELGPKGTGKSTRLFRVFTARHADLRRRGDGAQALCEQRSRYASGWSATGTSSPSTSLRASKERRQGTCRHHEELHGEQELLTRRRNAGRGGIHGLCRQHRPYRPLYAEALRSVRRSA